MPFRETDRVKEREELVEAWMSGLYSKSELARAFGVSRPSVDLWLERAAANEPLSDRSRAPHSCAHRTAQAIVERIEAMREERPYWGPKKIGDALRRRKPTVDWPADSTIGDILKRAGLVEPRPRPRRIRRGGQPPPKPHEAGQITTADFKGELRLGNGKRCYPLTMVDPFSRFIYAIEAFPNTSYELVQPVFERVFRRYGLPEFVVTDNGVPFCVPDGVANLSRLGVWCLKYGVTLRHSRPAHPQDNAIHERMHRSLKDATARPPQPSFAKQQRRFDQFRNEFNYERSHEGIGRDLPAELHRPSRRSFPRRAPQPEYPGHLDLRRVSATGTFSWAGEQIYLSASFAGEVIGFEEIDQALWSVRFFDTEIGRFDGKTKFVK